MAYEAYWDDVTVALRLNGTLPITCDKGNTVTNVGVTLGAYGADSGGVAAQIDADTDYLLIPGGAINTFGIAPLTVAFTFTPSAVTGYRLLWAFGDFGWSTSTLAFFIDAGYLKFYLLDPGTGGNAGYLYGSHSVATIAPDTTYKVMFCRDGRTLRVFVNGAVAYTDASFYKSDAEIGDPTEFAIGAGHDIYIGNDVLMEGGFRGSIDEFYIVKGVALESEAYTPADLFTSGGEPPPTPDPVTADLTGSIVLIGDLAGGQPVFGSVVGLVELSGLLDAAQPLFARMSGSIKIQGGASVSAGFTTQIGGAVELLGAMLCKSGVSAIASGELLLSGAMSMLHGRSASISGNLPLSGSVTAMHRYPVVGDIIGALQLRGTIIGDYLLHPKSGPGNTIFSVSRHRQVFCV